MESKSAPPHTLFPSLEEVIKGTCFEYMDTIKLTGTTELRSLSGEKADIGERVQGDYFSKQFGFKTLYTV